MIKRRLILFLVSALCSSLLAAGCETTTNTNTAGNRNTTANSNTGTPPSNANTTADRRDGPGISREDFEREKDRYTREAKEAGRKIGAGANDLWLWVKTRAALATADDLRDSTINVDVENDVVTLTGTVPSAAQKTRAEQVANGIEGVKSVKNSLQIAAAGAANRNAPAGNRNAR